MKTDQKNAPGSDPGGSFFVPESVRSRLGIEQFFLVFPGMFPTILQIAGTIENKRFAPICNGLLLMVKKETVLLVQGFNK